MIGRVVPHLGWILRGQRAAASLRGFGSILRIQSRSFVAGSHHHKVFPADDGQHCTPEQIFRSVLSGRVQGDHVVRPSKQPSFETAAVAPYRRRVVPLVRLKRSTRLSRLRASA